MEIETNFAETLKNCNIKEKFRANNLRQTVRNQYG